MTTPPTPAEIVTGAARDWLELADPMYPVAVLAAVVANRLPGDPVWLLVVAPPSSGKTVLISPLSCIEGVYPLSSLTSKTFTSGLKAEGRSSPSLLERLQERSQFLLTLKDFGTLLSIPAEARNAILAQLREIYDGEYSAAYGTGVEIKWRGHLGLIAAATPVVDNLHRWSAELGERFVQFRLIPPDRDRAADRAARNQAMKDRMREELEDAFRAAYAHATDQLDRMQLPSGTEEQTRLLARLVADARTPVVRSAGGGFEVSASEGTARLAGILNQLLHAAFVCYGGDIEAASKLIRRVAVDSIVPERRRLLLEELARNKWGMSIDGLDARLRCDTATVRRHLEDLVAIGLVRCEEPVRKVIYHPSQGLTQLAQGIVGGEAADALRILFCRGNDLPPEEVQHG